jgi:hypothetical protein
VDAGFSRLVDRPEQLLYPDLVEVDLHLLVVAVSEAGIDLPGWMILL